MTDILPIDYYFLKMDLQLFYEIIHQLVPIKLPDDIIECDQRTRSRHNTHYLFQLHERTGYAKRILSNSFLYEQCRNGTDFHLKLEYS